MNAIEPGDEDPAARAIPASAIPKSAARTRAAHRRRKDRVDAGREGPEGRLVIGIPPAEREDLLFREIRGDPDCKACATG
jgi:hypothetical protein